MRADRRPFDGTGACSGGVRVLSTAARIGHSSDCPCGLDR